MKLYFTTDFLCELIDRETKQSIFSKVIRINHHTNISEYDTPGVYDFTQNAGLALDFKSIILQYMRDCSQFIPSLRLALQAPNTYIDICQLSNETNLKEVEVKNNNDPFLVKTIDSYFVVSTFTLNSCLVIKNRRR